MPLQKEPVSHRADKNIDIRWLMANIKTFNSALAEAKGNTIRLQIDETLPHYVTGNEVQLYQVMNKLVMNAIQMVSNGLVTINITMRAITDNGLNVLFTVSYCANKPCKETSLHVTFGFKRSVDGGYKEWAAVQEVRNLGGIRILLVEDVDYNVMIAEKMLSNWNAIVEVAENGVEAITMARKQQYDIILMDLQMPVMDGYSATRHIRYFDQLTPIVALTASAFPEIMKENDGLTDFLAKPFSPADLYAMVYKYTRKKKMAS